MPRDNLLNSACLEFFDFIKRENIKNLITHLVETYRERFKEITYVDIFSNFIIRYEQTSGFAPSVPTSFVDTEDDASQRIEGTKGSRWSSGIKDLDASEEEYFNTSDDEEEKSVSKRENGVLAAGSKQLVDYASDEEAEAVSGATKTTDNVGTPDSSTSKDTEGDVLTPTSSVAQTPPPERLSEKRRREEDEEDDMSKLAQQPKRRNSTSATGGNVLKKKKSFTTSNNGTKGAKIAISLSPAIKTGGEGKGGDDAGN